jgi:hypothetical protein
MQFYEVATYAVSCGVICLAVFRALKREAFGAVWDFEHPFVEVDSRHIVVGVPPYLPHCLDFCLTQILFLPLSHALGTTLPSRAWNALCNTSDLHLCHQICANS